MTRKPESSRIGAAIALAVACLAAAADARAHDFWVQPERYTAAPGETVGIRLFIGDAFSGMPFLYDPDHIDQFFVQAPDGRAGVSGQRHRLTVGRIVVAAPGAWVVGYRSTWTLLTLAADRFEAYLEKEGFDRAQQLRAARGESDLPGREAYSRSAKAIILVGDGAHAGYDAVLGLPLELVPERSPATLEAGDALTLRLLLDGAPLADTPVTAFADADPGRPVAARTGRDGRVSLPLPRAGLWLVRAVHLTAAAPGRGADWESVWASLTFIVPGGE